jgi:hypothetical protein
LLFYTSLVLKKKCACFSESSCTEKIGNFTIKRFKWTLQYQPKIIGTYYEYKSCQGDITLGKEHYFFRFNVMCTYVGKNIVMYVEIYKNVCRKMYQSKSPTNMSAAIATKYYVAPLVFLLFYTSLVLKNKCACFSESSCTEKIGNFTMKRFKWTLQYQHKIIGIYYENKSCQGDITLVKEHYFFRLNVMCTYVGKNIVMYVEIYKNICRKIYKSKSPTNMSAAIATK